MRVFPGAPASHVRVKFTVIGPNCHASYDPVILVPLADRVSPAGSHAATHVSTLFCISAGVGRVIGVGNGSP
jgi:hypothetical protein